MLVNAKHLKGLAVAATDGELGIVEQFYFDDETWAVRYLTVDTAGWLSGRKVLLSPFSISAVNWQARRLDVALTKKLVQDSPSIDTHLPVSRQHETSYLEYYGYPSYWSGPFLWGSVTYPAGLKGLVATPQEALEERILKESMDSHLRSSEGVADYHIEATNGEIGHLAGFVMDDEAWAIRYIEVATRNWWPGKKVLLSPTWIERVSWIRSKLYTGLTREAIQSAPEYVESLPISREYEHQLHLHYGQPPYWLSQDERKPASSLIEV